MSVMRSLTAAVAALLCYPAVAAADLQSAGNVLSARILPAGVEVTLQAGAVARVEAVADGTLHVRFAPTGSFSSLATGATIAPATPAHAQVFDTADAVYIVAPAFIAGVMKKPYGVAVWRPDGTLVQADVSPAVGWDPASGVVFTRKWAPPDERYYGFGERGGPLNRRGRTFAMQNKDFAAYAPLSDPLYISIPYYWGARGDKFYGVFLDNSSIPFFNVDNDGSGTLVFGALAGDLDYYVFAGPAPADVAAAYGAVTGYSALPPRWTLGYHQSRYGYTSKDQILTVAATLRALQVPADSLYFDIDYLDRLQLFSWNLDAFPDPSSMNADLGRLGFHRVNIMEPLVHTGDRFWLPLAGAGFFLKSPAGDPLITNIWYGAVSWIDFTKTAAANWYRQTLAAFLGTGIDAVWSDLNEPASNDMPNAVYDFDGSPRFDFTGRNLYALREGAIVYQAQLDARPNVRPWGISRAGFAGIQRYIANWGGDELSDWTTLRGAVQMSLSMALSGQNFFGHDIGGFLGAPDAELFTRWMEFSAFTPLFRNHAMNTSPAREPWAFGEPTLTYARQIINERYRLLPYLYTLFETASRTGTPAFAPAFMYFPSDANLWQDDSMFMVGESLLVAPVLWQGATDRWVYLPAGTQWYDAYSDAIYAGGTYYDVPAPLGRPPVFIRAASIVPKGPVVQYVDEQPLTDVHLHLYGAAGDFATSFVLYEDDGRSFEYQHGAFLRTRISYERSGGVERATVTRAEGAWTPPAGRAWTLELRGAGSPSSVTVNGAPVAWTVDHGRVVIVVPDDSAPIVVEVRHDAK
jgi:alpha-glucosidase